jgi:hypothetical protein
MTLGRHPPQPSRSEKLELRNARNWSVAQSVRATERSSAVCGGEVGKGVPKGVKAKPGKRTPNKAEREWMDAIVASGCIACRLDSLPAKGLPCAVHHILSGGRRMGHLFTLPLCDPGHHQNGGQFGMVSRHPWKARFEAQYGSELSLLARLRAELGYSGEMPKGD